MVERLKKKDCIGGTGSDGVGCGEEEDEEEDEAWEELLIMDGFGGMLRLGLQVPRSLKAILYSVAIMVDHK